MNHPDNITILSKSTEAIKFLYTRESLFDLLAGIFMLFILVKLFYIIIIKKKHKSVPKNSILRSCLLSRPNFFINSKNKSEYTS